MINVVVDSFVAVKEFDVDLTVFVVGLIIVEMMTSDVEVVEN